MITTREFLANLIETQCQQRAKEIDEYRQYWYDRQSKKTVEQLQDEIKRFYEYYEKQDGFGIPVSITVAQEIVKKCKLIPAE